MHGEDTKMVAAVKSAMWGGDGGDDRSALVEVAVYSGLQNFEKHRKRKVYAYDVSLRISANMPV